MMLSRRALMRLVPAAVALGVGLASAVPGVAATGDSPIVVELFTSQGCSSCPPADKLLGELSANPNVIALTQAVDYWDYLGWKDENARKAHTVRQQNYARVRGDRRIYTPQMVINGRTHVVGSRRGEVERGLARGAKALSVNIKTETSRDALKISVAGSNSVDKRVRNSTLYLVPFKKSVSVAIKRGENRGRTVTYHNVVSGMRPIGMWHGDSIAVELPLAELQQHGFDGCAVLLQADLKGLPGPIHGAAMVSF
ncbi:DUF1223 domain-containing protein [Cohaesibacter sp. CAU 1516]|uniref:DUF1223 domain-containing protein n=1 Tax=Cohaesibacter sp. CAU 1516 TaxID=2576038 RepID=UPI001FEFD6FD|nr:DUF1223 domain-containing protein [Cohaesibacter sp. CAU 1516]